MAPAGRLPPRTARSWDYRKFTSYTRSSPGLRANTRFDPIGSPRSDHSLPGRDARRQPGPRRWRSGSARGLNGKGAQPDDTQPGHHNTARAPPQPRKEALMFGGGVVRRARCAYFEPGPSLGMTGSTPANLSPPEVSSGSLPSMVQYCTYCAYHPGRSCTIRMVRLAAVRLAKRILSSHSTPVRKPGWPAFDCEGGTQARCARVRKRCASFASGLWASKPEAENTCIFGGEEGLQPAQSTRASACRPCGARGPGGHKARRRAAGGRRWAAGVRSCRGGR